MSTVDEVLATAEVVDAVCVIDGETRIISVPNEYKELGVESDEKVTRIKFQCPKIVGDNVDLTEYNLYINYRNAGNKLNSYLVEDATVTGDTINFSWLLSRHVTESPGTISYIVCAKKSDYTGVINEWNTKVATGTVGVGLEAAEEIEEQNIDIIEQILRSIVELENKVDSGGSGGSGGYYAPSVDDNGNLTWTASKTDMPAVDGTNIKGPHGVSGVYVGSGDMPDGYNVQIDPDGTPSDITLFIDETLTEHGKAADAKATGDALHSLSEEIANLSAGGISATARELLITVLRNGVYISDQSANITDLETALGGSGESGGETAFHSITTDFVNVTSSNSETSVQDGGSYTATLTAAEGYNLDSVSVTMGGVDVTADVYANGVISIPAVTGNVEIMASASIIASEAVMVTSGLLAYWDFRAKEMANTFAPTIGDESKYRVDVVNTWDMTADWFHTQGFDCGNGPYGGVTIKEADDAGTFSTMDHGTVFTVAMIWFSPLDQSYFGFSEYYTNNGVYKTSRVKDAYVDADGNGQLGKLVVIDYVNQADTYHTLIVRVNGDAVSVYFDGTEYINDSGANYSGFNHWKSTLTIRAIKSYNAGYLTAMAMYNRALDDVEIVEMTEWLKTLEVTA